MQISFAAESEVAAFAAFFFEGAVEDSPWGGKLGKPFARAAAASRFKGGSAQSFEWLAPAGLAAERFLGVGLGEEDKADAIAFQRAGAAVTKRLLASGAEAVFVDAGEGAGKLDRDEAAANAAFGALLGAYRFYHYRTKLKAEQKPSLESVIFQADDPKRAQKIFAELAAIAEGVKLARDLVSEPPNVLYPEEFARRCEALSAEGVEVEVLDIAAMTRLGMGALLGVGQGSVRPSKLVVMQWKGGKKKDAPLAFVGKGVCFDTGGISLKPAGGMEDMKGDMGGAAAVTGAMRALAARKAKVNVVGVIGLVENMPDGGAQRPGDIVTSMSGQTIEVLNTDAEGRLVLADALFYTQERFKPRAIVDLATLTGAIVISLGHEYAGLFANDDGLAKAIEKAGKAEAEPVWRFPLGAAYDKQIDSPNADMKNIGRDREAGSITAAQFLQRFVKEGTAWAHLDIAGTAWKSNAEDPLTPAWATGYGVRLLNRLAEDYSDS